MIDQKKRMYQSETLSLLTLKLILTEAKKESPPQTRKEKQPDEELALNLIAALKKEYRKVNVVASHRFLAAKQSPSLRIAHLHCTTSALAGGVRERSALQVSGYRPRNDIKIEP